MGSRSPGLPLGECRQPSCVLFSHVLQGSAFSCRTIHVRSGNVISAAPTSHPEKKNRRRKIKNLSEGSPSSTSLAAPPPPPNPFLVAPEVPQESPLINVEECQVLASFKDPLNQLLEVDDLPGAKPDFFALVEDIVTVVRDHFHLRPPGQSPTTARKALDLHDPQAVQKCYAWNRRKLIRQLTSNNTERCRIAKDTLVQHFSSVWQAPSVPLELKRR
ncbi:hypothetical protein TNIN_215391 [Trichonephila inaurata madagascariensis]|uniref:Uncharacterized protein n=1 Tax=Trichonephila inaurata madagascariensis TaxID=2747483 RepID=A0A8X6IA40_9ARAC|nr:hypothetical protein TNIN_215391 [Trichonephila inaurata madagascariensis]